MALDSQQPFRREKLTDLSTTMGALVAIAGLLALALRPDQAGWLAAAIGSLASIPLRTLWQRMPSLAGIFPFSSPAASPTPSEPVEEDADADADGPFYGADHIVYLAMRSGQLGDEGPAEQLLIFASGRQQTWLVATQRSVAFVLDDVQTRSTDRLVQLVVPLATILKVDAEVDATGIGSARFGGRGGSRWFYSPELFRSPQVFETAIRGFVDRAGRQTGGPGPTASPPMSQA